MSGHPTDSPVNSWLAVKTAQSKMKKEGMQKDSKIDGLFRTFPARNLNILKKILSTSLFLVITDGLPFESPLITRKTQLN